MATPDIKWAQNILERQRLITEIDRLREAFEGETEEDRAAEIQEEIAALDKNLKIVINDEGPLLEQVMGARRLEQPENNNVESDFKNLSTYSPNFVPLREHEPLSIGLDTDRKISKMNELFECNMHASQTVERAPTDRNFVHTAQSLGARLQKPPKFKKNGNFPRFAKRFREHVLLCGLQNDRLHLYMLSFIECETTWEKLSDLSELLPDSVRGNIDSLIDRYMAELFPPTEARAMRTELLALKQRESEPLEEFCFRIREAAGRAAYDTEKLRNESSLQALVAGVKNLKIKEKLLDSDVSSFAEAVKIAQKQERITAAVSGGSSSADQQCTEPIFSVNNRAPDPPNPRQPLPPRNTYRAPDPPYPQQPFPPQNTYRAPDAPYPQQPFPPRNTYRVPNPSNPQQPFPSRDTYRRPDHHYPDQNRGRAPRNNTITCWNCMYEGHKSFQCPYPVNSGNQQNSGTRQRRENVNNGVYNGNNNNYNSRGSYNGHANNTSNNRRSLNENGAGRQ